MPVQPVASNSGSCSSTPSLIASGLVPGGQGSNTSGTFNGTGNAFVNVTNNSKLNMPGDFTYEMWVYPTSWSNQSNYFSNGVYSSGIILLQVNSSQIDMDINGTDYIYYYAPPLNAWTHLALERSGSVISLYANGNQVVIFTNSVSSASTPNANLFIGGRPDNVGNQCFIGKIDEFRYWNGVAIDQTTLKSRMTRELTPAERSSSNLTCEFKFNGDYTDATGNCTANGISASFAPANYYTYTWTGSNAPAPSTNEVQTVSGSVTAPQTYTVVASAPNGCPGPVGSTNVYAACASANVATACPGNTVNLTLTNSSGAIQWQSATNYPYSWSNISGATTSSYAYTFGSGTTYFRAISGGGTDTSDIVTVNINSQVLAQPIANSSGSCGGPQPTLTATGLVPGGQGSNTSGVVNMSGSSYVSVTANSKLQMPGDFTYEMWVYPTSYNNNPTYFSNGPYNNGLLFWQTSSNNVQLYFNVNGSGNWYNLTYGPPLNTWTHIALERSGTTFSFYANGSLVGNFPIVNSTVNLPTSNLVIGGRPDQPGSNGFIGSIDEFRYWNGIALDSNTLKSRMGRELTTAERTPNLSCEFKFNGDYSDATTNCAATGTSTSFAAANYYTYTWTGSNAPSASTNEVQTTTAAITPPQTYAVVATVETACPSPAGSISVGGACESADQTNLCPNNIVNLSLTSTPSSVQWQSSNSNSPYNWQNISGATTTPYAYTFGTSTTWFRAVVVNGGNGDTSNTVSVAVNSFNVIPPQPTANNTINCGGAPTLTASGLVPGGQGSNSSGVVSMSGGSYVNVTANTKLQMPGDFTYEMWVYPTSFNSNPTYFSNGPDNNGLLFWQTSSSNIQIYLSGNAYNLTYAPSGNAWTHIALERSGSTVSLYSNGVFIGNFTTSYCSAITPSQNLFIGGRPNSPGNNGFIGYIDEFRYWNGIALDPANLKSHMYRELTSAELTSANLSCEFKFNGDYTDASGNCTSVATASSFAAANYYTYTWSGSNAPAASTNEVQTATASITSPQLYTLLASVGNDCPSLAATTSVGACATASVGTVTCLGQTIDLSLASYSGTIQWQSSADGITFADISGATTSPYTVALNAATTYFRAVITNGGVTATSNTVTEIVAITAANFNLGISGSSSLTVNGTTSLCIANPLPGSGGSQPTGGTVTSYGGYRIHEFTTAGNDALVVPSGFNSNAEVFLVAGGGGGGTNMGGGGGGGGVIDNTSYTLSPGTISVTVGGGGTGAPAFTNGNGGSNTLATSGGNSVFGSLTAIGGGSGGTGDNSDGNALGAAGGSGGGASGYNNTNVSPGAITGGSGTAGQGNRGGNQGNQYYSGGGGGAGGAGTDANNQANGGPGIANSILGTSYFWGGGGGGAGYSIAGGNGGNGGGGGGAVGTSTGGAGLNNGSPGGGGCTNCQANEPGGNAGANTGGGGGGGSHYTSNNAGGNGGSGVVVVKYPDITQAGVWSSSNTSIATVDPSTGIVTGVGAGSCNIIYTAGISGCTVQLAVIPFTVNPAPAAICVGGAVSSGISANVNPPCTGGTVTTSGGYRTHVFTSSGTFIAPSNFNGSVQALVVAGGGGAGSDMGGGGGGGGVIYNPDLTLTSGTISVQVGNGGAGAPAGVGQPAGSNGGNSVFSQLTAIGGGGGGSEYSNANSPAKSGGSGGGASACNSNAGSGTAGQGFGGSASGGCYYPGGGGGAGGAGSNSPATGGPGVVNSILGTAYYWGGGGGGSGYSGSGGNGGIGGGGGGAVGPNTSTSTTGGAGLNNGSPGGFGCQVCQADVPGGNAGTNTGGGGGGGSHYNTNNYGGNGGSGIVIIKYPIAPVGTWTSSNTAVATVDSVGNVTGVSAGAVTITYTVSNGSCSYVQTSQISVGSSAVGTVSAAQASICTGTSTTLTLTGNSGTAIQWQQSADGLTGWTNVTGGSGANTTTYTTADLTSLTYFRVEASGACTAYSSVVSVAANLQPPTVSLDITGRTSLSVNGTSTLCIANSAATGGSVTTSGGYRIHEFTATGNDALIVPTGFSTIAEVFLVAGGGGGGTNMGGGGGGGGVIDNTSYTISSGSVPVTVGYGGAGAPAFTNSNGGNNVLASSGGNSVFGSLTAIGGGSGGTGENDNPSGISLGASGGLPAEVHQATMIIMLLLVQFMAEQEQQDKVSEEVTRVINIILAAVVVPVVREQMETTPQTADQVFRIQYLALLTSGLAVAVVPDIQSTAVMVVLVVAVAALSAQQPAAQED